MDRLTIWVINGPNLNLLGTREPDIYGSVTAEGILERLEQHNSDCELNYFQSNVEGELINKLQEADGADGVILNAGGYTHTSVALADAIAAINTPVVEVHLSNILGRDESERERSLIAKNCAGVIAGFGWRSYQLALDYFKSL